MTSAEPPPDSPRASTARARTLDARPLVVPALVVLALLALVEISVARSLSITCDEDCDVGAGVADVTHGAQELFPERPPLPRLVSGLALGALGLREGPAAAAVHAEAARKYGPQYVYGDRLLFEDARDFRFPGSAPGADSAVTAARLAFLPFPLVLALSAWLWARRRFGPAGGLVALLLVATYPDVLGHPALASEDGAFAALALASGFALDALAARGGARWLLALGVALGLALGAKLSGLFLAAGLGAAALVAALAPADPHPSSVAHPFGQGSAAARRRELILAAAAVVGLALLVVSLLHFGRNPLSALAREVSALTGYGGGAGYRLAQADPLGAARTRTLADWLYFPHALLLKAPLGTLALAAVAALAPTSWRRRGRAGEETVLHLPALVVGAAVVALAPPFGTRYVLAAVVFLLVSCGRVALWAGESRARWALVAALLATNVAGNVRDHPFHTGSTNALAGPCELAHRALNDTNQDMGGGLKALASWQRDRGVSRLVVVPFGAWYDVSSHTGARLDPARLIRIPWLGHLDAWGVRGELGSVATLLRPGEPGAVYAVSAQVLSRAKELEAVLARGAASVGATPERLELLEARPPREYVAGFVIYDFRTP